jgi:hypothetical protein
MSQRQERIDAALPILTELEPPPCHRWSIDLCDGTPIHEVTERINCSPPGDILSCSCGSIYSWSKDVALDDPCWHIVVAVATLLENMGYVSFEKNNKQVRLRIKKMQSQS